MKRVHLAKKIIWTLGQSLYKISGISSTSTSADSQMYSEENPYCFSNYCHKCLQSAR